MNRIRSNRAFLLMALACCSLLPSSAANSAYGFCAAPFAPSALIIKPNKPYCAAARNCSSFDVSSYRFALDSYFRQLENYARDVDRYYKAAGQYVECMSDLD